MKPHVRLPSTDDGVVELAALDGLKVRDHCCIRRIVVTKSNVLRVEHDEACERKR